MRGVSVFDLIPSEQVDAGTFAWGIAVLQANYGTEYSAEKTAVLFDMIREERWTEERFKRTLSWFVKNKKFPSWTISDWFDYNVKLYPRSWMLRQVKDGADPKTDLEIWEIEYEVYGWKLRDGETLPFILREDLLGRPMKGDEDRTKLKGYHEWVKAHSNNP